MLSILHPPPAFIFTDKNCIFRFTFLHSCNTSKRISKKDGLCYRISAVVIQYPHTLFHVKSFKDEWKKETNSWQVEKWYLKRVKSCFTVKFFCARWRLHFFTIKPTESCVHCWVSINQLELFLKVSLHRFDLLFGLYSWLWIVGSHRFIWLGFGVGTFCRWAN